MLDVNKVSIEWNDENAKLIIKLVEELSDKAASLQTKLSKGE